MEIACPDCGARESYLLADGRRQCRKCRKKFSPGGRKRKLAVGVQDRVREAFWEMQPAESVASANNINRKTVQRMYGEFRLVLARYNQNHKEFLKAGEPDAHRGYRHETEAAQHFPMFYLADFSEGIVMYRAEEFAAYSDDLKQLDVPVMLVYRKKDNSFRLDPEDLYRKVLWGEGKRCLGCLEYMLKLMKTYRGVHGEKAILYVEEMIFRFNCNDRDVAIGLLEDAAVDGCDNIMH